MTQEQLVTLTADAKELLNQLAIKLKDVKEYETSTDDDGYPNYNHYSDNKVSDEQLFLSCLKAIVERALEGPNALERNEHQYYNSNCY